MIFSFKAKLGKLVINVIIFVKLIHFHEKEKYHLTFYELWQSLQVPLIPRCRQAGTPGIGPEPVPMLAKEEVCAVSLW